MGELPTFAEDTISRMPASLPLEVHPRIRSSTLGVRIEGLDALTTARKYIQPDLTMRGKVAVLNFASDRYRVGGWRRILCGAQEEAYAILPLCRLPLRKNATLDRTSDHVRMQVAVAIFKDDLDVAAPRLPKVSDSRFLSSSDLHHPRERFRLVYRMAAHNGKQVLVLGAMGCGVYGCPPRQVAKEMKAILFDEEFVGWFKKVIFAVYPAGRTGKTNYEVFKEVFEGLDS